MALNYITLVLDLADRTGTPLATGQALLNPSAQLTDATDDMIVTKAQLSAKLAGSYPQARVARHRQHRPAPSGWAWTVSFPGTPGNPQPFTFFLPASPYSFTATSASPAVFTAVGSSYANGTPVVLTGSSPPGGFAGAPGGFHLAAVEDAEYEPVMLFINHSCEPNVGFAGNAVLVAKRDISPGEELTTDYALFDEYDGMMQCRCGTPSCRATIGSQDWQRPELQRKYGNYFSSYLLHRLARQPDRPG